MAGIYRRGSIYWARAQRKGREFRESLETSDRRVAERRFKVWKDRLEALAWGERPRVSFSEAARQFIRQHLPHMKPKAAERYGTSLKWLADKFDGKYLDEITRQTLSEFETDRRSMGVKASTVRRDLACLGSLLSFCEDREWIEDSANPVPSFLKRRSKRGLKEGPPRTRWLSRAEEDAILAQTNGKLFHAIQLAIDTGLREEEQFSLTWPQIDLKKRTILTTKDTKNGRARTVPLTERSAQFLAQWKPQQTDKVASIFVFSKKNGKRFKNLYRGFMAAARRAGVQDVTWHDLRRTAGCRWRKEFGKSLGEVSLLLGHSSIAVTEKSYAFLDQQQLAEEVAAQNPAHGTPDNSASSGKH